MASDTPAPFPHKPSAQLLSFFDYPHLPENLQTISSSCRALANHADVLLDESPEKTAGLRKLLEAKDCFVRAKLVQDRTKVAVDG